MLFRLKARYSVPLFLFLIGGTGLVWRHSALIEERRDDEAEVQVPSMALPPSSAADPSAAENTGGVSTLKTQAEGTAAAVESAFWAASPAFEHTFLEAGPVIEESLLADRHGTAVRRRFMQSPQYPDRIYVEEAFVLGADGAWTLESQKLEVADEWMLKLAPGKGARIEALAAREKAEVVRAIEELGLWTLRFAEGSIESRAALRERLEALDGVEAIHPNEIIWPTAAPNDPGYASQWEFPFIDAEGAWDILTDATINDRVTVAAAIIDTGVNVNSADLNAWVNPGEIAGNGKDDDGNGYIDDLNGYDFYAHTATVQRSGGHGVNVAFFAGRIGNNGNSKASASWKLDIMAGISFSTSGAGSSSAANQAISYAVNNGARVVNCSFVGGNSYTYVYSIEAAEAAGVIVVAGAGNNNGRNLTNSPMYPVSTPRSNVIGVGATNSGDVRAGYSNYGDQAVDVFAPAPSNGTSFATPVVTSIISLLIADDPEASHTEIIERLVRGVDKKDDLVGKTVSGGRVNMLKSLRLNTLRRPKDVMAYAVPGEGNRLFWTDQSTAETGFIVERSTKDPHTVANPDDPSQMSWQVITSGIPANTTTFLDTSVSSGQTYYYRVRAKGASRNSARNHTTRISPVSADPPAVVVPSASVVFQTRGSDTAILLDWLPGGPEIEGFVIERSEDGGASYYILKTVDAMVTGYADDDVETGRTYVYRIKAFTPASGVYSAAKSESAVEDTQLLWIQAPTSLTALANDHRSVSLAWTDTSEGELAYTVERATVTGSFETLATLPPDVISYTDTSVVPETEYRYRVVSTGEALSRSSVEAAVSVPGLPYSLTSPVLAGSVQNGAEAALSWTDVSENASGFRLERALSGTGGYEVIATLSSSARSHLDTSAPAGQTYDYRVAVYLDPADIPGVASDERLSEPISLRLLSEYEAWSQSALGSPDTPSSDDSDNDGWSNLAEFAVFESPTRPQPYIALPGMSAEGRVTLSFARRWNPVVAYVVQVTGDLGATWEDAARLERGENTWTLTLPGTGLEETGSSDRREVVVTDSHQPATLAPRYMRLLVE